MTAIASLQMTDTMLLIWLLCFVVFIFMFIIAAIIYGWIDLGSILDLLPGTWSPTKQFIVALFIVAGVILGAILFSKGISLSVLNSTQTDVFPLMVSTLELMVLSLVTHLSVSLYYWGWKRSKTYLVTILLTMLAGIGLFAMGCGLVWSFDSTVSFGLGLCTVFLSILIPSSLFVVAIRLLFKARCDGDNKQKP